MHRLPWVPLCLAIVLAACGSDSVEIRYFLPDADTDFVENDGGSSEPDTGEDTGQPDTATPDTTFTLNACGGSRNLTLEGEVARPGDSCGACSKGVVVCEGPDALRCVGEFPANPCGGCGGPDGVESEPCGPCGDGVWACNEENQLACEGNSLANECGGCTPLEAPPLFLCESESGAQGTQICDDPNTTLCFTGGVNACGGSATLPAAPGEACGDCGSGRWVCDGANRLACDEVLNACGGCAPLEGEPGEACGECGNGAWVCDAENNRVTCSERRNACGGCEQLPGAPGEPCENGVFACAGAEELLCEAPGSNACGGTARLPELPGFSCGTCSDGVTQCAALNQVECIGASDRNACGGCGELAGQPGETCGRSGLFECSGTGVACVEGARFACGGDAAPLDEAGEEVAELGPCGACGLGRQVCASETEVVCVQSVLYVDADGDGYGDTDSEITELGDACPTDVRLVAVPGDCDDDDASVFPDQPETPGDGIDANCDGEETCFVDADEDGYRGPLVVVSGDGDCEDPGEALFETGFDCDDANAAAFPGAEEVPGDAYDQNCDTTELCYADLDGDDRRDAEATVESDDLNCDAPGEAFAAAELDCDDDDTNVWASCETCADSDEDGFHTGCDRYETYVGVDCDDGEESTYPGAPEVCDAYDNDCDDRVPDDELDLDGDERVACSGFVDRPEDSIEVEGDSDCDDDDPDNWDSCTACGDADGDGWFVECDAYVDRQGPDCDDTPAPGPGLVVFPTATEVCGDGYDNNCDGSSNGCRFAINEGAGRARNERGTTQAPNDRVAWLITSGGDIDDDGVPEMLLHDPFGWGRSSLSKGRVYVFDADLTGNNDASSLDAVWIGSSTPNPAFGRAFSLPDIDDDTMPEWLLASAADEHTDPATGYLFLSADGLPEIPARSAFPGTSTEARTLISVESSSDGRFTDACVGNNWGGTATQLDLVLAESGTLPVVSVIEDGTIPDGVSSLDDTLPRSIHFRFPDSPGQTSVSCGHIAGNRRDDLVVGLTGYEDRGPFADPNSGGILIFEGNTHAGGGAPVPIPEPVFLGEADERIGSPVLLANLVGETDDADLVVGGNAVTYIFEGPLADTPEDPIRLDGWRAVFSTDLDADGRDDLVLRNGDAIDTYIGGAAGRSSTAWECSGELSSVAAGPEGSVWVVCRDGERFDRAPIAIRLTFDGSTWAELGRIYLPLNPWIGDQLHIVGDIDSDPGREVVHTGWRFGARLHRDDTSSELEISGSTDQRNTFASSIAARPDASGASEPVYYGLARLNGDQGSIIGGADLSSPDSSESLTVSNARLFGWDMSVCDDWGGTGSDWVAVGAPLTGGAGAVYLFDFPDLAGLASLTPTLILEGLTSNGHFGYRVDCSNDFTGNGRPDLLVSAPEAGSDNAGQISLFEGPPAGSAFSATTPVATGSGQLVGERFGHDASAVHDINGDGIAELLIGAPGADEGGLDTGAAYLFLSPHTGPDSLSSIDADRVFSSGVDGRQRGAMVASGDFDGDGHADLVYSSQVFGGSNGGAVFVRYGPIDPTSESDVEEEVYFTNRACRVAGDDNPDRFGLDAVALDHDGDGIDDLLFTATEIGVARDNTLHGVCTYFGRPGY